MAEAVSLDLVVADLADELRAHRRLLEPAGAPAVRFRESSLWRPVEQREDSLGDLRVLARSDRGAADVVDLAVVVVQAEQQRRGSRRLLLPAQADDDAIGRLVRLHLQHAVPRAGQVRKPELL